MPISGRAELNFADDDKETLYWLQMARRVLAGEIEPHEARNALEGRGKVTRLKRPRTRH